MKPTPHPRCYWVEPGKILAGTYPGELDEDIARPKLHAIVDAGVRTFINLMYPDEIDYEGELFAPYAPICTAYAQKQGVHLTYMRFSIKDGGLPTPELMTEILGAIDAALEAGGAVYLHCWGGHGRTGTVVGCYLIEHGLATADNFVSVIKYLRQSVTNKRSSPETSQIPFVCSFSRPRPGEPGYAPSRDKRHLGCLLGLAAGDALGTSVEFKAPGTFEPLGDMVGGGTFKLAPGQWTDDTSMALCLAESLLERGEFDPIDQLERYVRWSKEGYLSSTGKCFDIGGATGRALSRFQQTREPHCGSTNPNSAGNGSLMRLAPVAMAFEKDVEQALAMAGESSKTTHGALAAVDACRYFSGLLVGALRGESKEMLLSSRYCPVRGYWEAHPLVPEIDAVAAGSFKTLEPPEIEGAGYVVKSLEAALWAFDRSDSFREGALLAANLGDDADTTAAIFGQIAGAYYGVDGIPEVWRERLAMRELISHFALSLCHWNEK